MISKPRCFFFFSPPSNHFSKENSHQDSNLIELPLLSPVFYTSRQRFTANKCLFQAGHGWNLLNFAAVHPSPPPVSLGCHIQVRQPPPRPAPGAVLEPEIRRRKCCFSLMHKPNKCQRVPLSSSSFLLSRCSPTPPGSCSWDDGELGWLQPSESRGSTPFLQNMP